ncbi:Na+/H+ antiporter [Anaeromyxobacter terrae]|uniref:Na+/H+ antiporter n=1 Tax=Anaeromyxobacter terrae TaxID=2925406 RepID=UPI001F5620E7|nr:Na+/H+ antiporter [Anaeromyxobacter sp. SG22]
MEIRHVVEVVVLMVAAVVALATLARRLALPYPILLTLGGLLLGLVPGLPQVVLAPDLVFLLVLPPLLYAAAWDTSWRDFWSARRAIGLLALGLVAATVASVALAAHLLVGLAWAPALALGAIVSPTDAIAATAIAERLHAPRRLITVLEGESLVNDASGLVAYRFAIAATLTGSFSLAAAAGQFVLLSLGGIAVGVVVGRLSLRLLARLDDGPSEVLAGMVTAYAAYFLAERAGVSGVLACVAGGLSGSRIAPRVVRPSTRLQAYAVWDTLEFLLNGLVFILLGFQVREVWSEISRAPLSTLLLHGAAISATVIATRMLWVFPTTYLPRLVSARLRARDPAPPWPHVVVAGWAGMRGAVSLALALALPRDGRTFPGRGLIVYLTFCVILATLVGQGLTLGPLMRWLGVVSEGGEPREELEARRAATRAGMARIEALLGESWVPRERGEHLRGHYQDRLSALDGRAAHADGEIADADGRDPGAEEARAFRRLRLEGIREERRELIRLRNEGALDDDAFQRIERDLDLAEERA